jgi:hypothetical protein
MLGDRAELLPKQKRLQVECEALRDRLRSVLPVHIAVDGLDGDEILDTALAIKQSLSELAEVNRMITILERQLGM